MSNLGTRAVSAVVLAIAVLWLTWLGGLPFRIMVVLAAALVYHEWVKMAALPPGRTLVGAMALVVLAAALVSGGTGALAIAILAIGIVVALVSGWWLFRDMNATAALAYAGVAAIALGFLRDDDMPGLKAILFLFAVVWATDIAAYFCGKALGGPKLAPSISPGKTWSGAIGGAAAGVVAGVAAAAALGGGSLGLLAFTALVLTVISQAGDLFESAIKRHFGVKDSSHIIPGHGGLMDRVDGLVAAGLALYLIGAALSGLDQPSHGFFAG